MAEISQAVLDQLNELIQSIQSLQLATISKTQEPLASYSPFINIDGAFYILISSTVAHYDNILHSQKASIMLIEDESKSQNIYARRRVYYTCKAEVLADDEELFAIFKDRHGEIIDSLTQFSDFHLVKLSPLEGNLILGFGQAYKIAADHSLSHVKGKGHSKKKT